MYVLLSILSPVRCVENTHFRELSGNKTSKLPFKKLSEMKTGTGNL